MLCIAYAWKDCSRLVALLAFAAFAVVAVLVVAAAVVFPVEAPAIWKAILPPKGPAPLLLATKGTSS